MTQYSVARRTLVVLVSLGTIATGASHVTAQSSSVADLLRAITTSIRVENSTTAESALCHGFVGTVRRDIAYVATAKHCIEKVNSVKPLSPTNVDGTLTVTVEYASGQTGTSRRFFWDGNHDDVIVAATFDQPPTSLAGACPNCRAYDSFYSQQIPVLSVLSTGGGPAVVSSGTLLADRSGRYSLALPASPGTSGSAVFDLRGNLVGIIVSALVNRSAQAGWMTNIVPGGFVFNLVKYAVGQIESPAPSPSSPAVRVPPQPPLPPCDGSIATRDPSWRGSTCQ